MGYYESIRDIVGHTPLMKLNRLGPVNGVNLFAKLEYMNPGGSMKDRIGIQIIKEAEEKGELKPGGTVIEATAGNTGIGLALAAVIFGYRTILVVSGKFSEEKRNMMRALGAELVETSPEGGIDESIIVADEMAEKIPGAFLAHQFKNEANTRAHLVTGEEIWEDLDGKVDVLVAGAGSGGSISGIAKALKKHNPKIKVVLADPVGSILGGGDPGVYKVEGIGNHFIPEIFDRSIADEVEKVRDEDAYYMARIMALKEGVIGASSSGEALAAGIAQAYRSAPGTNIVMVFPDRADRYLSENIYHFEKELSDYDISDHIKRYEKDLKIYDRE
ncbi:MAG: cysteine synthase family protein [Lachnospiraceae bacterium]|nr:cysteine synthase family protein [Lachnospiraceae bacterium]